MQIRFYRADDAPHLGDIYVGAIRGLAPAGYTSAQVEAWAGRVANAEETHDRCSDGRLVLVATDHSDTPVAFIDLEDDGHIDMMFCRPDWAGRRVASALFRSIEAAAMERHMPRLYTEASEIAKPVFSKWGFNLVRRNDMEIDGIAIHNYIMEKPLGGGGAGD